MEKRISFSVIPPYCTHVCVIRLSMAHADAECVVYRWLSILGSIMIASHLSSNRGKWLAKLQFQNSTFFIQVERNKQRRHPFPPDCVSVIIIIIIIYDTQFAYYSERRGIILLHNKCCGKWHPALHSISWRHHKIISTQPRRKFVLLVCLARLLIIISVVVVVVEG